MVRLTGYLRARIGRRIALLFFLCALVPIASYSLVAWIYARGQLEDQSRERLRLLAKENAQTLNYRLHAAALESARWAEEPGLDSIAPWFDAFVRVSDRARPEAVLAGVGVPPVQEPDDVAHLERGEALVRAVGRRVLLATSAPTPDASPRATVWFALNRDYLLGRRTPWSGEDIRAPLPAALEICLVGPEGPLSPCPDALLARLREAGSDGGGERLDWRGTEGAWFSALRPLFLRSAFRADTWQLVVSESERHALAPARGFQRTFLLATLLSLLVVPFASQVQIRRNLEPLQRLEEGTRRLAERDFESRVEIASGDEFEALAGSFNHMADRLGKQFGALRTANEIDRAILSELQTESILTRALAHMRKTLPGATVAVASTDEEGRPRWHGPPISTDLDLPVADGRALLEWAADGDAPDDGRPLELPTSGRAWSVFPVRLDGAVPAAILVRAESELTDDDVEHVAQMADRLAVALANARLVGALDRLNLETITAFARAIDAKSAWTAGHSERVTEMSLRLAGELGLSEDEMEVLRRGALLHDIGKIGVPGAVLDKPGRLTDEEFELMRSHTTMGATILEPVSGFREIVPIARHHHERWDGCGYPDGLAGEDIPRMARIVAVADVFDALSSARPYRDALPLERVVEMLVQDAGTAFDPVVIAAFQRVVPLRDQGRVA